MSGEPTKIPTALMEAIAGGDYVQAQALLRDYCAVLNSIAQAGTAGREDRLADGIEVLERAMRLARCARGHLSMQLVGLRNAPRYRGLTATGSSIQIDG